MLVLIAQRDIARIASQSRKRPVKTRVAGRNATRPVIVHVHRIVHRFTHRSPDAFDPLLVINRHRPGICNLSLCICLSYTPLLGFTLRPGGESTREFRVVTL